MSEEQREVPLQQMIDEAGAFGPLATPASADEATDARRDGNAPLGLLPGPDPTPVDVPTAEQLGEWVSRRNAAATLATAQALEAKNNETIRQLAAQGVQVGNIMGLRWDVLLSMVFDETGRAAYELAVQELLERQLADAASQVARAKLTAPLPASGNGARLLLPPR